MRNHGKNKNINVTEYSIDSECNKNKFLDARGTKILKDYFNKTCIGKTRCLLDSGH